MSDYTLAVVRSEQSTQNDRIKRLESTTQGIGDGVNRIATQLEVLVSELQHSNREQKKMQEEIEKLKSKPGARWDLIIQTIISSGVAVAVSAFISLMLG